MGKKGKWLTSVKKAFKSPIRDGEDESEAETRDLDLFGDIRPLAVNQQEKPKQKNRRWSFGMLALSEDRESEKKKGDVQQQRDTSVMSNSKFTMYMYPSQEEWAAVVIQTAFRGYLARKSLRALRGLVRLQVFVRGHRVMRQANKTMRSMQALAHVQGRIRAHRVRMSEEGLAVQHQMWQRGLPASRKASEGLTESGWNDNQLSAQQIEAKMQERQVAALKRERAMTYAKTQQVRRASPKAALPLFIECEAEKAHWGWSYMERWSSARPWESSIFESNSALKDVADSSQVSRSVDASGTRNARDLSCDPKHPTANGRRASLGVTAPPVRASGEPTSKGQLRSHGANGNGNGHGNGSTGVRSSQVLNSQVVQAGAGGAYRQSRVTSPRSRCGSDRQEEAEESGSVASGSATARTTSSILTDPQFGTRYSNSGPVRNGVIVDTEVKSPPVMPGHLQATQSAKNKARATSQPRQRQRPAAPAASAFKTPATMKRLSYTKSDGASQAQAQAQASNATSDTEGVNPRNSGQLGKTAKPIGRPKSGVLPGPHGSL